MKEVSEIVRQFKEIVQATLDGNAKKVAEYLEYVHDKEIPFYNTRMMQNGANSLSCMVTLCYLYARNRYVIKRKMNLEKIDYVFLPKSRKEPYR